MMPCIMVFLFIYVIIILLSSDIVSTDEDVNNDDHGLHRLEGFLPESSEIAWVLSNENRTSLAATSG